MQTLVKNIARQRSRLQVILWLVVCIFVTMNIVAYNHAHTFTHFTQKQVVKTKDAAQLSVREKLHALVFGINNPRLQNTTFPTQPYQTIKLQSYESVEAWRIPAGGKAKGTVILFHGYSGNKSGLLDKAAEFLKLGYHTMLVDFPGSGGSGGNQTTIGYKEAEVVKDCYTYLQRTGEKTIYLFGTSMGAVALMKAIHEYALSPSGIVIECPFGTMYETTVNRFHTMHVPEFPFAPLLVFWGGVSNGFWAFSHNPEAYAKSIHCPTLLMYGNKDDKVSTEETNRIFQNLPGNKQLVTFEMAGHENYLLNYKREWTRAVGAFLEKRENK